MTLRISVVICAFTEQRWDDVHAAVGSLQAQRHAPHEIILSVDHNPGLHARLRAALPDVVVVENRYGRGLSGGKNTGVELARGDVVAFLDDDAVAAPGWLAAFADRFAADPAALGVGGRTLPLWPGSPTSHDLLALLTDHAKPPADPYIARDHAEVSPPAASGTEKFCMITAEQAALAGCDHAELFRAMAGRRPRWFPEEFDWTVGCTYRGMARGQVRNLMGGNCAFRAAAFELAGGFRTGIGRGFHRRPLGCEETEFCIRLSHRSPGSVLLFDDRAVIWHRVPRARARFGYFRARCYAEGLSKALVTRSVGTRDGLACERAHAFRTLPRGAVDGLRDTLRGDASGLGRAAAIVAGLSYTTWGYAVGSLAARRRAGMSGPEAGR
ncbi:MAG: glycosyltransferase family 2 protein [Actinomadura sp.]